MPLQHQSVITFAAGIAIGSCLALAVARFALSPRRQWSWKEWRSWQAGGRLRSAPSTPTKQAWAIPDARGTFSFAPTANQANGNGHTQLAYSGSVGKSSSSISPSPSSNLGPATLAAQHDDIISEQFTRNAQFFGEEGQLRIHGAFVIVVGLGGVGSHAATMLLRSGIGRIRIVSLSSLNRHAVATRSDVGIAKAICLRNHFAKIFPEADIDARVAMFDTSNGDDILAGAPDYVLDCIDNIDTKVALVAACYKRKLRILSATGAGARADPTRIRIADISESSVDPLSRAVRYRLRREHGIEEGIAVVFSTERPKAKLLPFETLMGQEANPLDYQIVPGFRVRIIPVLGTIPAIFGQAMATHVLITLAGLSVRTEPVLQLGLEHYALLHRRLVEREELRFGSAAAVEVDEEEVAYVVRELWRGRSARDQGGREVGRGMWRSMNNMTLTRWDQSQPPDIANLVLLTFQEAEEHESMTLAEIQRKEPKYFAAVTAVLGRAYEDFQI
eukprot:SM000034S12697  [mRNA]  locus=s34:219478:222751:- [translate_table: standard]